MIIKTIGDSHYYVDGYWGVINQKEAVNHELQLSEQKKHVNFWHVKNISSVTLTKS